MIATVTLTAAQAARLAEFVRILDLAQIVPERGHEVALAVARQVAAQVSAARLGVNCEDAALARHVGQADKCTVESERASERASVQADDRQGRLF